MESPTRIEGENIALRPLLPTDAPAMFASLGNAEAMRLTGSQDQFTFEQVADFCARVGQEPDRADFIIEPLGQPNIALGEAVLNNIDTVNEVANFRIALYDSRQFGRGIGTEATRLIVGFGFRQLALHRIELEVYAFNPRARRAYEKVGFRVEGVRRDALLWEGERIDAIQMAILADDFRAD